MKKVIFDIYRSNHLLSLFFALFINGISEVLQHCNYLIFDIRLYLETNSIKECYYLQENLNDIDIWTSAYGFTGILSK